MDFEANLGLHQLLCTSLRCRRNRITFLQQFGCVKGFIMKARFKFCLRSVQNIPSTFVCKLPW